VYLLADDRAGRGPRWGSLQRRHRVPRSRRSRPRRTHRQRPQRSTRTAQHHRLRQQPIASKPKHSRCCKSCNRARRPSGPASSPTTGGWPASFSSATPAPGCWTATARHHGDTLSPNPAIPVAADRRLKASWFPTRRPGTSTAPASAPPRPRARRPPQPYRPRHTERWLRRTQQCRRYSVGVPTVAHRFAQRHRPGAPRLHTIIAAAHRHATAPAAHPSHHHHVVARRAPQKADLSLPPISSEHMPCYCSRAAPSPMAPAVAPSTAAAYA